jgi:hypothetical protein
MKTINVVGVVQLSTSELSRVNGGGWAEKLVPFIFNYVVENWQDIADGLGDGWRGSPRYRV